MSEIENVFLLPAVFLALAASLKFSVHEAQAKLAALQSVVYAQATQQIDGICLRYTRRRVDAQIKKIGLSATNITALDAEFKHRAASVDPISIFNEVKGKVSSAIASQDYATVLLYYDNKGLLNEAAKQLGFQQKSLEEFVGRTLRSEESSVLHSALVDELPAMSPRP